MNLLQKKSNKSIIYPTIMALISALLSSLCCIAPLIYLLFGFSATWLVSLHQLSFLQLPMLILSLSLFAYGGWQLFFAKRLICQGYLSRRSLIMLYIVVAILLFFLLSYPYVLPWLLPQG